MAWIDENPGKMGLVFVGVTITLMFIQSMVS